MKLIKASKDLAAGMKISRGGFTKREHLILSIEEDDSNIINIEKSCDLICNLDAAIESFSDFKRGFYKTFDSVLDLRTMKSSEIEQMLLRNQTYPERSSSLLAFICALSSIIQKDLSHNRSVNNVENIINQAYASNSYWQQDVKDMVNICNTISKKGCSKIKHHVGVLDAKEEAKKSIELIKQCEDIDEDITHAFDLNCAYNYDNAALYIEILNNSADISKIFWIEEPIHFTEYHQLGDLQKGSDIPIAAGENAQNSIVLEQLMQDIKIVMPDLGRNCNPADLKRLATIQSEIKSRISIHNYGSQCLFDKTLNAYLEMKELESLEIDLSNNPLRNSRKNNINKLNIIQSGLEEKQLLTTREWRLTKYES